MDEESSAVRLTERTGGGADALVRAGPVPAAAPWAPCVVGGADALVRAGPPGPAFRLQTKADEGVGREQGPPTLR